MPASVAARKFVPRLATSGRPALRLLHVFPSFSIGGIQRQFSLIVEALGPSVEHVVVALDGCTEAQVLLPAGAIIDVVTPPSLPDDGPLARLRAIRGFLRRTSHAVVLTYNWGAIEWCLANRMFGSAPGIHCEHGFGADEADRPLRRRSRFRQLALGSSVPLVVPSQTLRRVATDEWGIPDAQIRFVPNGVDPGEMARRIAEMTEPVARRDDEILLGCVAPLRAEKNIARLLRSFAAIAGNDPRWRLVLAGDGPERGRLEIVAQQLAIRHRVQFLGWVVDPVSVFASIDVAALSSDTEQSPFSVLEAAASACPIVATDVGDIRAMVAEANRPFIVAREAEDRFTEAMRCFGDDATLRRHVGAANRDHVAMRYAASAMVAAFRGVLDEALNRTMRADAPQQNLSIEPAGT